MSDLIFTRYKNNLMQIASNYEENGDYFSSNFIYKFICKKQEEFENSNNKDLFFNNLISSELVIKYAIDGELERYAVSIKNNEDTINECIAIFNETNDIKELIQSFLKMEYSIDVINSYKKKGIPINVESNLISDINIKFNERILEVIKLNVDAYKIEFNSTNNLDFIEEKTINLLNDIEFAQNSLKNISNYNFCFISLKQLSGKVQDYYSQKTINK